MDKKKLAIAVIIVIVIALALLFFLHHHTKKQPPTTTSVTEPITTVTNVTTSSTTISSHISISLELLNDTYYLNISSTSSMKGNATLYYGGKVIKTFNLSGDELVIPLRSLNSTYPLPPGDYDLVIYDDGYITTFPFTFNEFVGDMVYSNGTASIIVLPALPQKIIIGNETFNLTSAQPVYNGIILVKAPIGKVSTIKVVINGEVENVNVVYVDFIPKLPYSAIFE